MDISVKKMIAVLAPLALILSACTTTDMATTNTTTTSQQLGTAALKIAINAKCTTELNNLPAWKTATKFMTADQKPIFKPKFVVVSVRKPHKILPLSMWQQRPLTLRRVQPLLAML